MRAIGRVASMCAALLLLAGSGGAAATTSPTGQPALVTNIRVGPHPGFDRIVLDVVGPLPQARHWFADELIADASGDVVWLTGQRFAVVALHPAATHTISGEPSYPGPWRFRTWRLVNVMAVAITGDAESQLALGIGLRHEARVTVFTVDSPPRVVIDVAH